MSENNGSNNKKSWIETIKDNYKKIYSQSYQDGIIQHIIKNISIENNFCVEFGFNSTDIASGSGANCANLVLNHNWDHVFIGPYENKQNKIYKHFLTTENIIDIFYSYNIPTNLGYLSVDVDSTDLWLLDKVLQFYSPSFYSVEYNCNIPHDYAITCPNDTSFRWCGDKVFGASLKCFDIISKKYNYTLVHALRDIPDAFYVRNDLLADVVGIDYSKLDVVKTIFDNKPSNGRYKLCLDYEYFLETGDVEMSQKAAEHISSKYLINKDGL